MSNISSPETLTRRTYNSLFKPLLYESFFTDSNKAHIDLAALRSYDQFSFLNLLTLPRAIRNKFPGAVICLTTPKYPKDEFLLNTIDKVIDQFENEGATIRSNIAFNEFKNLKHTIINLNEVGGKQSLRDALKCFKTDKVKNCKIDKRLKNISLIISAELSENVAAHSESTGFVWSNYYNTVRNKLDGVIRIGISDSGVGIKNTLRRNPKLTVRDDKDALLLSIKQGTTCKSKRGLGLNGISRYVKENRGSMYIRSGSAKYSFSCKDCKKRAVCQKEDLDPSNCGVYAPIDSNPIFGTQIEVAFYIGTSI